MSDNDFDVFEEGGSFTIKEAATSINRRYEPMFGKIDGCEVFTDSALVLNKTDIVISKRKNIL